MKKFSLARLLIATVIGSHLLLATGLIVVGMSFSSYYLHSAFDNSLKASALNVAANVYLSDDGGQELKLDAAKIPRSSHHHHPDIYSVDAGNEKNRSRARMGPRSRSSERYRPMRCIGTWTL